MCTQQKERKKQKDQNRMQWSFNTASQEINDKMQTRREQILPGTEVRGQRSGSTTRRRPRRPGSF